MEESDKKKEQSFIHERIVPRKNARRIILAILATVAFGILIGGIAGLSFYVSQKLLGLSSSGQETSPTLVVRHDVSYDDEAETDFWADFLDVNSGTPGSDLQLTVKDLYNEVRQGLVKVLIEQPGGEDWLGTDVKSWKETFGAVVMETNQYVFILTDATDTSSNAKVEVFVESSVYETRFYARDERTGLGIVQLPKDQLPKEISVIALGNSSLLRHGDRIFMIGTPFHQYLSIEEGMVTHAGSAEGTWDGYRQLFYTDRQRSAGSAALLFNASGEIVCWMSDYSAGDATTAVAAGVNSLKYLIEDLCLGQKTAYLGINCHLIDSIEASLSGLQSGAYVLEVAFGSPAYKAGIQKGDRIHMIDGHTISGVVSLQSEIDGLHAGDTIQVTVARRNGTKEELIELTVKTGSRQ